MPSRSQCHPVRSLVGTGRRDQHEGAVVQGHAPIDGHPESVMNARLGPIEVLRCRHDRVPDSSLESPCLWDAGHGRRDSLTEPGAGIA